MLGFASSLLHLALAATVAVPQPGLRSIADVAGLSEKEMAAQTPVEVEGVVTASLFTYGMIIDDGTPGYFTCDNPRLSKPSPGDVVRVRGQTNLVFERGMRQESILVLSVVKTDERTLPTPKLVTARQILDGQHNLKVVRLRGFISEAIPDETNLEWSYLVLMDEGTPIYVTLPTTGKAVEDLVDADVELTGAVLPHYCADRLFVGPHLEMWSTNGVRVVSPAPADPFDVPALENIYHVNPDMIAKMRRRSAQGTVIASFGGSRFLLREDGGRLLRVELSNELPPKFGQRVKASGYPETDLFHLNLSRARWKPITGTPAALDSPEDIDPAHILSVVERPRKLKPEYYGRTLRMRGILRNLPAAGNANGRLNLECGAYIVPVDVSALPQAAGGLSVGCELEVTGVCLMEAENWRPSNRFPVLGGFSLVPRVPEDVVVLSRPPWWTTGRLMSVIAALLVLVGAVGAWNLSLKRLAERRGRELLHAQIAEAESRLRIDERTRLAAELHDYTAQNLTAISYQITAARSACDIGSAETGDILKTADRMMLSCRAELRRCLWDLKNDALDECDFSEAVRKTIEPVSESAAVTVRFDVRRASLSDQTAHTVLSICRELVANAVRHGKAEKIRIAGEVRPDGIRFLVRDNGVGFDPARRHGLAEGHFGLDGVLARIHRIGGTLQIDSAPGQGTKVTVTLTPQHSHGKT